MVLRWVQCRIQDFFGQTGSLLGLISPLVATRAGTEMKTSKICLSGLKELLFWSLSCHLLHTSCTPLYVSLLIS